MTLRIRYITPALLLLLLPNLVQAIEDSSLPGTKSEATELLTIAGVEVQLPPLPADNRPVLLGSGKHRQAADSSKMLPAPTKLQVEELLTLEAEELRFREGAKDYRQRLDAVVRHYYEERRRRVLNGIDRTIAIEKGKVDNAREHAIARLEDFVKKYSGEDADPVATPDAMYRLAALYEDKARSDVDADIDQLLQPVVDLYVRIVTEFPAYREAAGVHYYLGHILRDMGRLEESQQSWRALACSNHYQVQLDPENTGKLLVAALPQDHDRDFWFDWENKHPYPLDESGPRAVPSVLTDVTTKNEEIWFRDPYPEDCVASMNAERDDDRSRYVAEVWWQIGNFHFDQNDQSGGPYAFNRAESAYKHAVANAKPPLYGVVLYKLAWTYFREQRYEDSVRWFVKLLDYADEQEALTGDPGADFRSEAYTYIAGSLTYLDFRGPGELDPYIPRDDVLDYEQDPQAAEDKMAIAIERVQQSELIPQDRKWSSEIYKSLALEYLEVSQQGNAIRTLELVVSKFPLDREAPRVQNRLADIYEELSRQAKEGSPLRDEYSKKALEARTALSAFVGNTPWTVANKNDPEALATAEELVKVGLQRAAADHTNYGRAYVARADEATSPAARNTAIQNALDEYQLAVTVWGAFVAQDPNAIDAYDSRFWLADANYWVVYLKALSGVRPTDAELKNAYEAVLSVRDSNEEDKFLQPASYYLVRMADALIELEMKEFEASGGTRGLENRESVGFVESGTQRKVQEIEIPLVVKSAINARQEYNDYISLDEDAQKNGILYALQQADYEFVYGHFDDARQILVPLMAANCGRNEWGYKAWEKLVSMSNFEGNAAQSRELVEQRSCAFDEESLAREDAIRKPVKQGVAYMDARALYDQAEKMAEGPARRQKWKEAAAAYNVALDAAPDRNEAPEAAMNGAYAYKQVGEYDKAIAMYSLFISNYGNEQGLALLKNGGPGKEPEPEKFAERVEYLKLAYDALASAYVLFFDYPKALETFASIANNSNFPREERLGSAQQSLQLHASLGSNAEQLKESRDLIANLGADPEQIANADFVVASADLKKWDPKGPNSGSNAQARQKADQSMRQYFEQHKAMSAAAKYSVEAAYWVARSRRAEKAATEESWWRETISAFDRFRDASPKGESGASSALGSVQASMAAEAAYVLLDREITQKFDYESGHHRYKGTPTQVLAMYEKSAKEAELWLQKLQGVIDAYSSPEWGAAAISRQGSLYDTLRSALFAVRPPELIMFDAKTEKMLQVAEASDDPDLMDQADQVRFAVEQQWNDQRDKELASADQIMTTRYASAVMFARKYSIANRAISRAVQRLAFYTEVLGDAKMSQYTASISELNYQPGMFAQMRPGMITLPESTSTSASPLPVKP